MFVANVCISCEMETDGISKEDVGPKAKVSKFGEVKDATMIKSREKEKESEKDIRALFDSDSEWTYMLT